MHFKLFRVVVLSLLIILLSLYVGATITMDLSCTDGRIDSYFDYYDYNSEIVKSSSGCDKSIETILIGYCRCEGTYEISVNADHCPDPPPGNCNVGCANPGLPSPRFESFYKVDFDDPSSNFGDPDSYTDVRLFMNEPYYCKKGCVKWYNPNTASFVDIDAYWDPDYNTGPGVTGECCGDDFDPDDPTQPDSTGADDPDRSEGFCKNCPLGNMHGPSDQGKRDWNSVQKCCGDDFVSGTPDDDDDLGAHGNYLCFYEPEEPWSPKWDPGGDVKYVPDKQEEWHWLVADGNVVKGAIVDVYEMDGEYDYNKYTYYSDGSAPWKNAETLNLGETESVLGHEYLYYEKSDGDKVLAECCGSEKADDDRTKCFSVVTVLQSGGGTETKSFGGERYKGGEAVTDDDDNTYYCTGDAQWEDAGNLFDSLSDSSSCFEFGCSWTGHHCCCDFLDSTYSDPESEGGTGKACWKGELVSNENKVEHDTDDPSYTNKVINEDGQLYFCKPAGAPNYGEDDVGNPVESKVPCEAAATSHCDVSGVWESETTETQLTYSPTDPNDEACCVENKCWLGQSVGACIPDQSASPSEDPYYYPPNPDAIPINPDGKLCIKGEWIPGVEKFTPYGTRGNCISQDQCLFAVEGSTPQQNPEAFSCEETGFYYKDFYCQDGEWATRTKLLAMKLMEIGQSKGAYTLTCGNAFEILNNFGYNVRGQNILDYFYCDQSTGECLNVNNFCLLEYGNNMLIGTSINRPVDDPVYSIMNVFDYDADCCNDFIRSATTDYVRCDGCNLDIWFNEQLGIFIYNRLGEELTRDDPLTQVFDFLLTPVTSLFDWIMIRFGTDPIFDPPDYDLFVEFPERFDKLYVKDFGGRKTFAVMETQPNDKYFTIRYEGFTEDMCDLIEEYDDRVINPTEDWRDYLVCEENSPGVYDVVGGSYLQHPCSRKDLKCLNIDVWRDLTTKLK